jgi:2-iminobutanoate/2-iminopropanoate deaminase
MPRLVVFTPNAFAAHAHRTRRIRAAGLIFVSDTAPLDAETGAFVGKSIQEQTRQCLKNVAAILKAAGSSIDRVIGATVILADERDLDGMKEEWFRWFPACPPAKPGARSPIEVPGHKVSIAAIAEA